MKKEYELKTKEISISIKKIIDEATIFDLHTHLFPPEHKAYYLSGLTAILNYHYLIAELLSSTQISAKDFYLLDDNQKANLIWDELFLKRTPMSEACQGVLTILSTYLISTNGNTFEDVDKELKQLNFSDQDILNKSKVESLVMTNNPFDDEEWSLFKNENWDRKKYRASLRLDSLISEFDKCLSIAKKNSSDKQDELEGILDYLDICYQKANPVYAAISLNGHQLEELINNKFWSGILKWLELKKLSLSLMLGVKRAVNKNFDQAGDGIGYLNLINLSELCVKFSYNKFLTTCLSLNDQHELTVLSRKHPNLTIFGFWWFMNQPSIIEPVLKMRIDLLGLSFIPQHSDARITDQLIYKWFNFKSVLKKVMTEYYLKLQLNNFPITEEIIYRDITNLLKNNAVNFLNIEN